MTNDEPQALIDELDDLLEAERTALLAGDLTGVASLVAHKERLFDALNTLESSQPSSMLAVQQKIQRNQNLLEGALQGIKRASAKLAALRRVRRQLETYGSDGKRHTIEGKITHRVEKRA